MQLLLVLVLVRLLVQAWSDLSAFCIPPVDNKISLTLRYLTYTLIAVSGRQSGVRSNTGTVNSKIEIETYRM